MRLRIRRREYATEWDKLFHDIRRQNRRMLERGFFELTAAHRIGREASHTFDLDKCLRMLVDKIADLMSVEIVSIMLIDKYQEGLVIKIAKGLDTSITKQRIEIGQGIAGWIAETGQALLIKDLSKDLRFSKRNGRYYTDSLLSVPLKIKDKVIGVVNVNNKINKNIFTEDDLDMLQTVADLIAAAIESARLQQEAKSRDDVRFDFISNVSHELRAPLATIKEAVRLILDGITGDINEKQGKVLKSATQNIDRLGRLIDELLELAKVESKITRMNRRQFDAVGLIEGVIISLGPLGKDKKIVLKGELPSKKIEIWADPDKLIQVLTNLIDNAIKYNKPNGEIEIGLEEKGSFIKIYVRDNGIGMPEEDLVKIFDRFHRVEMHTKGKVRGTGIGLSITKDIIQKHGGEISVESKINKGSRFTVTLPKDLRKERR